VANTRKFKLSVDPLKVTGVHVNMPVLATRANFPDEFFDPASANRSAGNDLRVFDKDGTTETARELVGAFALDSVAGAGDGAIEVWQKWPLLDAADPTPYLWLEYGDRTLADYAVADIFGRNAVWSLCDLVSHGSHLHIDSSGNIADATVSGTITTANSVFGLTAGNFNADGDVVNWGNQPSVLVGRSEFSTTLVYNQHGSQKLYADILRYDGAFNVQYDSSGIRFVLWTPSVQTPYFISGADPDSTDLIHQYYYDGATRGLEVNGGALTNFSAASSGLIGTTSNPLLYGAKDTSGGEQWQGDIALVIFWKTARGSNWRTTEYNNQSSPATFATAGTPVAIGGSVFSASFSGAIEQSALIMAPAAVPAGRIATIAQAFVLADETAAGLSKSALAALEFGMALSLSEYLAAEIASDMRATNAGAVENSLHIQAESLIPASWSGAVQFIFSSRAAVEITAAFGTSAIAATESGLQVQGVRLMAVAASATIVATELLATEPGADFNKGTVLPVGHMAVALAQENIPDEQITDYFNALGAEVETLAVVKAAALLPVTWDGISGFISGISQIFTRGPKGRGTRFAGRGRIAIFPNRKRN